MHYGQEYHSNCPGACAQIPRTHFDFGWQKMIFQNSYCGRRKCCKIHSFACQRLISLVSFLRYFLYTSSSLSYLGRLEYSGLTSHFQSVVAIYWGHTSAVCFFFFFLGLLHKMRQLQLDFDQDRRLPGFYNDIVGVCLQNMRHMNELSGSPVSSWTYSTH